MSWQLLLTFRSRAVLPRLAAFLLLLLLHSHSVGDGTRVLLTDHFPPDTPAVFELDDQEIVLHPRLAQESFPVSEW